MRTMLLAAIITFSLVPAITVSLTTDASAQATCRAKCTDEESACLKRTSNKGQCGDRAKTCVSKCK